MAAQLSGARRMETMEGALCILEYLLFGFRRCPDAFHGALPLMVKAIEAMLSSLESTDTLGIALSLSLSI